MVRFYDFRAYGVGPCPSAAARSADLERLPSASSRRTQQSYYAASVRPRIGMESPARASDQGQPTSTDVDLQPHRDLSDYSNTQLRAMVASAQELARRAAGELRERKTP